MNPRTTIILAVALAFLGLGYFTFKLSSSSTSDNVVEASTESDTGVARKVLGADLGDVVKIVCRHAAGDEWVFEKQDAADGETPAAGQWRMTAPRDLPVVRWEVERISNRLTRLDYEVDYPAGAPGGVTPAAAGLDQPEVTVVLHDAEGQTETVEIGKPASAEATYVRVAGSDTILVGKDSLDDLLKAHAWEYRDRLLWSFKAEDVTRVEIADQAGADEANSFVFAKDGARWMMEAPAAARATSKVDELLRSMGNLRVTEWLDDRPDRVASYGLDPAALTLRITVTEEVAPPEPDEEEGEDATSSEEGEEPAEPQLVTKVYELDVSDRSPIGDETKVYVRVSGETGVGTIPKTTADQFRPVMAEWREMGITNADVGAAERVELTTPEGGVILAKKDGHWLFAEDDARAEDSAVQDLLDAIAGLKAVVFVDGPVNDPAEFGLDEPVAQVRLTIPGTGDVERIAVGGYTDPGTKRLVYVRRGEGAVAKVRAGDVKLLLRNPRDYRDRTVFDVAAVDIGVITLDTPGACGDGRGSVTLGRAGESWAITAPAEAPAREQDVVKLVDALAGLRAEEVVAASGDSAEYEFGDPAIEISLTNTSTSEVTSLAVVEQGGKIYGKRGDEPTVYRLTRAFYELLSGEYRDGRVMTFEDGAVTRMSIRSGESTHVFNRAAGQWTYEAEPDLPLDSAKIENLLLQIGDLRTSRFVAYVADELSAYGLSDPVHEVTISMDDESSVTLFVSGQTCRSSPREGYYATVQGSRSVFLLTSDTINRFSVSLDQLEAEK